MNHKIRRHLFGCLMLAVLVLLAGCAEEGTPYERNDADGYSVSVKFDANGGIFTTNTSVIVDSFSLAQVKVGENGHAQIALIPPDHEARGNDAFAAVQNGYFLAGWYRERTTNADGTHTYAGRWDFAQDVLEVDPNGSYTSQEPVLTLYAAWVPLFQVEFVDRLTGEHLGSYTYDPTADARLRVPQWNAESGAIEMYKFPSRAGYTFESAYYDAEGTQRVETEFLNHSGTVDYDGGTAQNPVLTVYTDYMAGEWYHIYHAQQLLDHASVSGSYVIHEDLDFEGLIWPTSLMHGNFSGTIEGNGHVLRNIAIEQTNNSKINTGLFGSLSETAVLSDLSFENVSLKIKGGTRVAGAGFGLLSGSISDSAVLTDVSILSGQLLIDANAYFGTDDYVIGLVCGVGNAAIDRSGITAAIVGESAEPRYVEVNADGILSFTDVEPTQESTEQTQP